MSGGGSGRGYPLTLLALAVGAAAGLWSLTQPWATRVVATGLGPETTSVTGSTLYPVSMAAGWVALAAVAAVVATSGRLRSAIGVLVVIAAAAVLVAPVSFLLTDEVELATGANRELAGELTVSNWWILTATGGLLVAVAGVSTLLAARNWRSLSSRQAGKAPVKTSAWDALDRGEDPTA